MQTWPQPVRLTETGPMFRYDRPQAGTIPAVLAVRRRGDRRPGTGDRRRAHRARGSRFYRDAGLAGVEVHLNSIGDPACRPAYVAELTEYYRGHVAALPELERDRLERNVLRLLDSNDPAMAALNAQAPRITDQLCGPCAEHFASVRAHLDALGVPYKLDPGLVRGLDYYTRTAFEFYVAGREGQQQAIGGGGRYDGLVELLGGRPTPGIGFGIGLDRLDPGAGRDRRPGRRRAAPDRTRSRSSSGPIRTTPPLRLRIATELRAAGIAARADLGRRKLGKQLEVGRSRPRPLRGHPRRRAGRRRGRAARPAGRHAEAGRGRGPRARDRAFACRPPARGRPGLRP